MDMNRSLSCVLRNKKLFVFDMDGTLYLGDRVLPGAAELICRLRALGGSILFFTNNASHNPSFYYNKLKRMGFDPREGEVLTSGDVTELLAKGCVRKTGLRSAKTHTKYDATLHLDYNADGKPILRPTFD